MLFSPTQRRERPQLRISERRFLLMAGDAMAVVAAVLVALAIWANNSPSDDFDFDFVLAGSPWFFILTGLWLLLASANDFYDLRIAANRAATMQRLLSITAQMLVVYLIVFFFSPRDALPRLFILYFGAVAFILIGLWRFANPALIGWASQARKLLIVGTDASSAEMIRAIQEGAEESYEVVGLVAAGDHPVAGDAGAGDHAIPVLGAGDDLMHLVHRHNITEIVVTSISKLDEATFRGLMDAYEKGVAVIPMPLLYERLTGRVPVEYVSDNWAVVLPTDGATLFDPYPAIKRAVEIVLSFAGMCVLVPLLPLIALLIRLDSRGGTFYSQKRVGYKGRIFRVYKFRTMVQNAEAGTGAVFSQQGDPRVTRVGRFMRKTRIDELPQLYNILRGDMSLIGPRPERPEHVRRLGQKIPFYRTRLTVRPGLTGWAQVRYGYGSTDEDALVKLQYDLYYIRHQSPLLDLTILIRTVGRVLKMSGV
jgi:exopolysaccharide biosynthesis polyprenyl glycosylphosphotransferase